jgi:hypothetical protein
LDFQIFDFQIFNFMGNPGAEMCTIMARIVRAMRPACQCSGVAWLSTSRHSEGDSG